MACPIGKKKDKAFFRMILITHLFKTLGVSTFWQKHLRKGITRDKKIEERWNLGRQNSRDSFCPPNTRWGKRLSENTRSHEKGTRRFLLMQEGKEEACYCVQIIQEVLKNLGGKNRTIFLRWWMIWPWRQKNSYHVGSYIF